MIEHRNTTAEVRTSEADPGMFEAVVLNYGVVDTYNTTFDPGCFRESLEERLPRITWGHDWKDVIGQYVDHKDSKESLTLVGQLDDFEAVPRAKQAYAQLRSGTIDQFSVGFTRKPGGTRMHEEREHFTRCGLDEAALVLSGSVPGTKLVSVRSSAGLDVFRQVPEEYLDHLAELVESGAMSKERALIAIDLAGGGDSAPAPPVDSPPAVDLTEAFAEADEAMESFLG